MVWIKTYDATFGWMNMQASVLILSRSLISSLEEWGRKKAAGQARVMLGS